MTTTEQDLVYAKEVVEALEMTKLIAQALASSLQIIRTNRDATSACLHATLPVQRELEKSIARLIEMTR